jgi:alpha-L-rhamnosidase
MLKITRFTCENLSKGCVTDEKNPRFSYAVESDRPGARLERAVLRLDRWQLETKEQIALPYAGPALKPFTTYEAGLEVRDDGGQTAVATVGFETGRMDTPWDAQWITDGTYQFREKRVSPIPMAFRKRIDLTKKVRQARIYATALGIYELELNGKKVGDQYFAPGFTSYRHHLQYQTYDVTRLLAENNTLTAVVGGGWAVGAFVFTRVNRVTADRQALLLELRITYEDGTTQVIGTDESWEVTRDSHFRYGDWYDGEIYDATVDMDTVQWRKAAVEKLKIHPKIEAAYGAPVVAHERLTPISCIKRDDGTLIYDFGQNFAGVVDLTINGRHGQVITVKHAELLNPDGSLNVKFLRTAKATVQYTCLDGVQHYSPKLTYMGFRYISVEGIGEADLQVSALALYSDLERTGDFACSNEMLNRLQQNILWSSKSNFLDIPTDCPQRDERMGWTGDIAVFSPVACYNFNMSRFLGKWMLDLQAEQLPSGGVPNTIPLQGFGFPATMPVMAVDWWDDACILVPWNEYRARGDRQILEKFYPGMKKYVKACTFWAGLLSFGKHRYIWDTPGVLHFGDWVTPDVPQMSQWQARAKWTATASLKNSAGLVARIARILEREEDAVYYEELSAKTADAYCSILTDGNGKLLNEFQTAYVLPLYLDMFPNDVVKANAARNLAALVEKNDYCIGTGFPGTPYILFALADNGYVDAAYKMLLNTKCPSWLYQVKMGATTIWERWDGLDEKGECPIGDDGTDIMISYNHYASGAVGDFLYRRVAGIEAITPGYREFFVRPVLGGGITWAQSHVETPYGRIEVRWELTEHFAIDVTVPMGTTCELQLPDGTVEKLTSGQFHRVCPVDTEGS